MPELRMQLGTLLGLNGEPAEVPGWGYVPAWLARRLVAQMHSAEWRDALCDRDGHVIDGSGHQSGRGSRLVDAGAG